MKHPDTGTPMSLQQELNYRQRTLREMGVEPSARSVAASAHVGRTGNAKKPPVRARAPRAAGARTRGSRRTGASSSTSSADPGDDGEPSSPRVCGGCGGPLIGKAPQARYHDDACRMRARRLAAKPHRPVWTEAEIIALALTIEPFPVIAGIMEEPPGGYVPPRRRLAREWATGPGRGHRAKVSYGRMAVVA